MAIPTRVIKRRIKSVRSTRKIMKAMELVAASKMRKATQLTIGTRPYERMIEELAARIRTLVDSQRHPLLSGRGLVKDKPLTSILIVAASDRGLCGGFNAQIIKKAVEFLQTRKGDTVKIVTIGRRADQVVRRSGLDLLASFEAISNAPSYARTQAVSSFVLDAFLTGQADRLFIAYTDFKGALSQIPNVKQLLPVIPESELTAQAPRDEGEESEEPQILFEPNPDDVLAQLLPQLIRMEVYQALLESSASEHSARMMAMRSAGDAAKDMLDDLTFTLNQARQASITREISEISAGKAAIE